MSSAGDTATPDRATGRVLVVEDDPHICELVLLHLRLEGLTTASAADGTEGLNKARTEPFDLVILDVMLPGLDGITVCRAIRREPHLKDLPILMLTARREESDKVNGLESGADDYLTKPFGMREFIARVRALLRRRPHRAAPHPVAQLQDEPHLDHEQHGEQPDISERDSPVQAPVPDAFRHRQICNPSPRP